MPHILIRLSYLCPPVKLTAIENSTIFEGGIYRKN